jgi:hypothetical protein
MMTSIRISQVFSGSTDDDDDDDEIDPLHPSTTMEVVKVMVPEASAADFGWR